MSLFTNIAVFQFLPNFHRNDGTVTGNQNVISADLQNISQGHHLQKSYLRYYATNFNQTITNIMQLGLATKVSHQLTLKM